MFLPRKQLLIHSIIPITVCLPKAVMMSKPESLPELFDRVKAKFPESVGPERWYLVTVSKNGLSRLCFDWFR